MKEDAPSALQFALGHPLLDDRLIRHGLFHFSHSSK